MVKKALIILADGFEEIEAITAIDILRRAQIEVIVAGLSNRETRGSHGIKVSTDILLDELKEETSALILPGGSPGAENLAKSPKVASLINKMFKSGKIIGAICAAPALVLEPAGVLKGKKATCFPGMEKLFSREIKFTQEEVVRDGNIITSRGPGTALAFALKIVEVLLDKDTAQTLKEKLVAPSR
ncbi:MAG: DJ-1/PfpI family protein [Candidatus Omnitrophota bacterium]|nr:DJ-1/PfpI family protein [Candidatus Omnitrophota bacterium]